MNAIVKFVSIIVFLIFISGVYFSYTFPLLLEAGLGKTRVQTLQQKVRALADSLVMQSVKSEQLDQKKDELESEIFAVARMNHEIQQQLTLTQANLVDSTQALGALRGELERTNETLLATRTAHDIAIVALAQTQLERETLEDELKLLKPLADRTREAEKKVHVFETCISILVIGLGMLLFWWLKQYKSRGLVSLGNNPASSHVKQSHTQAS